MISSSRPQAARQIKTALNFNQQPSEVQIMVGGASNLVSVALVMFIHQCRSFFEKTYDKINWDFLISYLRQRGFHNHSSA